MNEIIIETLKYTGDAFVKACITETVKKLLNIKWRNETEEGKSVLQYFEDEEYLNKFSEKIEKDILTFRTLSNNGQNVRLESVYYPLRLKVEDTSDVIIVQDNETIPHDGVVVISGTAGQGKTTILRKLFLEEIKLKKRFPVFISLRDVTFTSSTTVLDVIKKFFEGYGIPSKNEEISFLLQSSQIILFYDGFDEIAQQNRQLAKEIIRSTWFRYNCRTIVTTRPFTEIYKEAGLKNLKVEKLVECDLEGVFSATIHDESKRNAILKLVSSRDFFKEALVTPIMIDILTVSYYSLHSSPKTIADFYSSLFRSLMYAHDNHKNWERERFSCLDVDELRDVFDAFSFYSFSTEKHQFNEEELDVTFKECLSYVEKNSSIEYAHKKIRRDIVEGTNLISMDGVDFYTYIHKSIQEYHAANFYSKSEEKKKIYYELTKNLDAAQINFLSLLQDINAKDFYKYYLIPSLVSLGFKRNAVEYANGYPFEHFLKTAVIGSTVDFYVKERDSLEIMGEFVIKASPKAEQVITIFNKMCFLTNFMVEEKSFNDISMIKIKQNGKISLQKNGIINEKVLKRLLVKESYPRNILSYTRVKRKIPDGERVYDYRVSINLEDIYENFPDATHLEHRYEIYKEMVKSLQQFYARKVKPVIDTKNNRQKVLDLVKKKK